MEQAIAALRAVGEPTRLRIVALLQRGELAVSELVQILSQSQPRVSRHLKLLADAHIVERQPEGAWVFYRLAERGDGVRAIVRAAIDAVSADDMALHRDLDRLAAVKDARAAAAASYFRSVASDWDDLRLLHLPNEDVETAMREAAGAGPFNLLVDAGTGTGRILQVFADRIRRGVGVDLSHEMLKVARHNLDQAGLRDCTVRQGDLYHLPFDDGAADLATIHMVLHFLDRPEAAVAEAGRILRSGGRLLIVDFASHDLEFLRIDHAHRRLGFADEEVTRWAEQAGLDLAAPRELHSQAGGLTVKIWLAHKR